MSNLKMPMPDAHRLAKRSEYIADFLNFLNKDQVIHQQNECRLYESDSLNCYTAQPMLVLLPETTEDVVKIVQYCCESDLPVICRGAGTSLTGGALPLVDGIVLSLARMRKVLDYDPTSRFMRVEAGVTNLSISDAVASDGLFYAPDPSSQLACTIGGNVAMNSGGAHSLKYGVTTNNVVAAKVVLHDGEVAEVGSSSGDEAGIDLLSLIIGSEGTLGIVTEITVRLLPKALGARPILLGFASNEDAGNCVAAIIAAGIIPVAIEFIDRPALEAIESYAHAGYPLDCAAVLIVEVEGSDTEIDRLLSEVSGVAKEFSPTYERIAKTEAERVRLWKGRKSAFSAMGALSPDYFCIDGVIPHSRLSEVLSKIERISAKYQLQVANIFHAGDGNLHPLILFDSNKAGQLELAENCGADILKLCVDVGGCLSGEHGVGVEKRDLMGYQFDAQSLAQQYRIKEVFDAQYIFNKGKVLPS